MSDTHMPKHDDKKRIHGDYTVGWVCALPKEQTAATAMLDRRHDDLPKPPNDINAYTLGSVGKHNVVIACLPKGKYGTISAATVATCMISTFPSIRFGLMVGIGGGIPPKVRLGDVVVSIPQESYSGVVQWDMGRALGGGRFERTGALDNPPSLLLTAVSKLESSHDLEGSQISTYLDQMKQNHPRLASKYLRTDSLKDVLFKASYGHVNKAALDGDATLNEADSGEEEEACRFCDKGQIVKRKPRNMHIHYGLIASGNQVIKDAAFRDKLNKELGGHVLCVEMEAAGLMNFPCLVIRGICDYADSHKNNDWQEHAAAVAAAFAKELLSYVQPSEVDQQHTVKELWHEVSAIGVDVGHIRSKLVTEENREILNWLTPINYGEQQSDYLNRRHPETGQWLIDSKEFRSWLSTSKQTLFCPGIPGAGKTILTSIVVDQLHARFRDDPKVGIAYIYCNYQRQDEQSIDNLLASVLKQFAKRQPSLLRSVKDLYSRHKTEETRPSRDDISKTLQTACRTCSRVFIVVDALDECQAADGCRANFLSELFRLQTDHRANIFATSRHDLAISDLFKDNSITLEIRASTDDVARYLGSHISHLPLVVQDMPGIQNEIIMGISKMSYGMFLLAKLYLDRFQDKTTPNDIRRTIHLIREHRRKSDDKEEVLAAAYEQALERINAQMPGLKKLAMDVLSWLTCAKRQLTTSELRHALATKPGNDSLNQGDLHHIRDLVSVCAGLVTIDEESDIIRLVHYTTQEYLIHTRAQLFPRGDSAITITCLTYLSFDVFKTGPCETDLEVKERLRSNPLYSYASGYWIEHATNDTETIQAVVKFLQDEVKVKASMKGLMEKLESKYFWDRRKVLHGATELHLAVYLGLIKVVDILLETTQSLNVKDAWGRTPLFFAVEYGRKIAVGRLLAAGADVNIPDIRKHTPLMEAVRRRDIKTVDKLLAAGADTNMVGFPLQTALRVAVEVCDIEIVEKLLAAGADVNALSYPALVSRGLRPKEGQLEIINLLEAAGLDEFRIKLLKGCFE